MTAPVALGAVVDLTAADAALRGLAARARDLSPFWRGTLDPNVSELIRRQFETQGRVWGPGPWAPLSPTTVAMRSRTVNGELRPKVGQARAGITTPMQNTRRLWAAYTKGGGPESIRLMEPQRYERGANVPYAGPHHTGFPSLVFGRKTGNAVPARPVLPRTAREIPAPIANAWSGMLAQFLVPPSVADRGSA